MFSVFCFGLDLHPARLDSTNSSPFNTLVYEVKAHIEARFPVGTRPVSLCSCPSQAHQCKWHVTAPLPESSSCVPCIFSWASPHYKPCENCFPADPVKSRGRGLGARQRHGSTAHTFSVCRWSDGRTGGRAGTRTR